MNGIEFSRITANRIELHVAEAGPKDGPLLVLLHGFPEFWFAWRAQVAPLAAAGYHVIAPDQRGYNLSSKPKGVRSYLLDELAGDILALADHFSRPTFRLVGHDWGATVAWHMATITSARLDRLAVINAPHPALWKSAMLEDPAQRAKSRYVQMLRIPVLPELAVKIGGYRGLREAFKDAAPEAFDLPAWAAYEAAWRQPGALNATINWYRALFLQNLPVPAPKSLSPPTLILWGDRDAFAERELAEASAALCADARVVHLPDASHWIPHDAAETVNALLLDFLG